MGMRTLWMRASRRVRRCGASQSRSFSRKRTMRRLSIASKSRTSSTLSSMDFPCGRRSPACLYNFRPGRTWQDHPLITAGKRKVNGTVTETANLTNVTQAEAGQVGDLPHSGLEEQFQDELH